MGCHLSKLLGVRRKYAADNNSAPVEAHVAAGAATPAGPHDPACKAADSPAKKPKLNPKDFMFMNLKHETRVKLPGEINGQPFVIDGCEGCDLYLMDNCAMVTIDDCKDCRIFVGPTDSSIFMRTSSNCRCVFLCRQLRTRDCTDCHLLLFCRTRPIIESSSALTFSCYSFAYPQQQQQLAACKLSPFHNFWSDVHDFTPPGGAPAPGRPAANSSSSSGGDGNYTLAPPPASVAAFLEKELPEGAAELFEQGGGGAAQASASSGAAAPTGQLLQLWGNRPRPSWARTSSFLLFPPGTPAATILQLLQDACGSGTPPSSGSSSSAGQQDPLGQANSGGSSDVLGEDLDDGIQLEEGCLLVRSNEAQLAKGDLQQLAGKAGWAASQASSFAGTCVGVEVAGLPAAVQQLETQAAAAAKALSTCREEVAAQFRFWGIEG